MDDEITVSQWETIVIHKEKEKKGESSSAAPQNVKKRNEKEQKSVQCVTRKEARKMKVKEAIDMLEILLIPFSVHNHTNIVQLHRFKCSKDNLVDGVLISEDFSEN